MGNDELENKAIALLAGSLFQNTPDITDAEAAKLFNTPVNLSEKDDQEIISAKDLIKNAKLGLSTVETKIIHREETLMAAMNRSYSDAPSKASEDEIDKQRKKALEDIEQEDDEG